VISALLLVSSTAWVRDKIKKISIKQLYKLDNFYMQLNQDRKPASIPKKKQLGETYEKLHAEYLQSQEQFQKNEEKSGLTRAMQGVGGGDTVYSAAEKMTMNWLNFFIEERKAPITKIEDKIKNNLLTLELPSTGEVNAAPSKETTVVTTGNSKAVDPSQAQRRPSSINVGIEQTRFYAHGLQMTYQNLTKRSDIQLEFGEQVKSILNYQLQDQTVTWSLSTGF